MINYYLLTKPGIILGNLITVAAGFLLASKGQFFFGLFLATMLGLAFIIASACVFNNYIDRNVDQKMKRTQDRPLAKGAVSAHNAIIFAVVLGIIGCLILLVFTNVLTVLVASVGFFVYVLPYSLWKCRTVYGTAIGSIAGAIPPVVGYCAVSNRFDIGAFILFMMLVLWQMPHFFAIAMYRLEDYAAASIPVLPVKKGLYVTKVHMLLYIIAFMIAALMLTVFHYTGYVYLFAVVGLGLAWLKLCMQGFKSRHSHAWAHQMFRFSLVTLTILCLTMSLDVIK